MKDLLEIIQRKDLTGLKNYQGSLSEKEYQTLILEAASVGGKEILKYLIENFTKKYALTKYKELILLRSISSGDLDSVKYLVVEQGYSLTPNDDALMPTALMPTALMPTIVAARLGKLDILCWLVNEKAAPAPPLSLFQAVANGHIDVVNFLVEYKGVEHRGTFLKEKDDLGNTAAQIAFICGKIKLLELLLEKGASIEEPNLQGDTILSMWLANPPAIAKINKNLAIKCLTNSRITIEQVRRACEQSRSSTPEHQIFSDINLILVSNERKSNSSEKESQYIIGCVKLRENLHRMMMKDELIALIEDLKTERTRLAGINEDIDLLNHVIKNCPSPETLLNEALAAQSVFTLNKSPTKKIEEQITTLSEKLKKLSNNSTYKVASETIKKIQDVYQKYKEEISKSSPAPGTTKIIKDYILTIIANQKTGRLDANAASKMDSKLTEDILKSDKRDGSHLVFSHGDVHFKLHIPKDGPCYPAVEQMVGSFHNVLVGDSLTVAPTQVVKVKQAEKSYIFVASQTVSGMSFKDYLKGPADKDPDLIRKINGRNFSEITICSMLTRDLDAKADNYIVKGVTFLEGEEKNGLRETEENDAYKVVNVDADQALGSTVVKNINSFGEKRRYLNMKNVLYFFPQMNDPIDKEFQRKLLDTHAVFFILDWLKILKKENEMYYNAYEKGLLTRDEYESLQLPIRFSRLDELVRIYEDLIKIQKLLKENQQLTHANLFKQLYPDLALHYESIKDNVEDTCQNFSAAAKILKCEYQLYQSSKQVEKRTSSTLAGSTPSETSSLKRDYQLPAVTQFFLETFDFSSLLDNFHKQFLDDLRELSYLESITIRNCDILDDQMLGKILSMPNLREIKLIACNNVTKKGIENSILLISDKRDGKKIKVGLLDCSQLDTNAHVSLASNPKITLSLIGKTPEEKYESFYWEKGKEEHLFQEMLAAEAKPSPIQVDFLTSQGFRLPSAFWPLYMTYSANKLEKTIAVQTAAVSIIQKQCYTWLLRRKEQSKSTPSLGEQNNAVNSYIVRKES